MNEITSNGIDGFLGTRASIMLDVVFLAMFAVVPLMSWSIWLVKSRRNYTLHKRVQLLLGTVLLIAVVLFEVDMRFLTDWRARALKSRFYEAGVFPSLYIHLAFAIPTLLVWTVLIVRALRQFESPPRPGPHSSSHKFWGWIGAALMTMTALTGWIFYALAFIC